MNSDISLSVPAESRYILPLRLFAAGIAIRMDFPPETIEDIKMAVAEAGSILINGAKPGALMKLGAEIKDDVLEIEMCITEYEENIAVDDISNAILKAMSDECDLIFKNGTCSKTIIRFKN